MLGLLLVALLLVPLIGAKATGGVLALLLILPLLFAAYIWWTLTSAVRNAKKSKVKFTTPPVRLAQGPPPLDAEDEESPEPDPDDASQASEE